MKILLTFLFCITPLISNAKTCAEYERELGNEIQKLFGVMRELYMENILPHITMDRIMTEMHLQFNSEYRDLYSISARQDPEFCSSITEYGIAWVDTYRVELINELSQRN